MSGWGVSLLGFGAVIDTLEDVRIRWDTDAVYVTGASVEYAVYQELGTSKMEPNPFLQPAVNDFRRNKGQVLAGVSSGEEAVKTTALYIERRAKHYASSNVPPGPDVQSGDLRASIAAEKVR